MMSKSATIPTGYSSDFPLSTGFFRVTAYLMPNHRPFLAKREKMSSNQITLAAVEYLNTVPLINTIDRWDGCQVQTAVPAQIASMVLDSKADLGLISLIDAARYAPQLALVPCSMIGCDGPTMTVLLCSKVEPKSITNVYADTESHTSVILADLALKELHNTTAEFVGCDFSKTDLASPDSPETVLMIGDKVITDAPPADIYPHQIDLGEAWKQMTGLPFVYAVWMCKSERADDPQIHLAGAMLERVYKRNQLQLDHLVATEARKRNWPADSARKYIGELLRFEVTDSAITAAELFLSKAAKAGHVDAIDPLWVEYAHAGVH
jgi:chorismate dehydratase